MAATGLLLPKFQFFDDNGEPLAAGLVYTYAAGSTTPQATYTSSTLGTPNANPIVLDSSGRCVIYPPAVSPALKLVLKTSAGVTVWTQDNISPAAVAS